MNVCVLNGELFQTKIGESHLSLSSDALSALSPIFLYLLRHSSCGIIMTPSRRQRTTPFLGHLGDLLSLPHLGSGPETLSHPSPMQSSWLFQEVCPCPISPAGPAAAAVTTDGHLATCCKTRLKHLEDNDDEEEEDRIYDHHFNANKDDEDDGNED